MKKLFLLITLLVMFPFLGNAQLNVKRQTSKIETIASTRMGMFSLKTNGDLYFLVTNTTNQFDDPFILYVGEDMDSARQTLIDLRDLCGNIEDGASVVIDNAGEECNIYKEAMGGIRLHMDRHAGFAQTNKMELNKIIKALSK